MRRAIFIILLVFGGRMALAAAPWPLLQGDLSGELVIRGPGGFPPLHWQVKTSPSEGENASQVIITAPGLVLEVLVDGPMADGSVRWRIERAEVDLAQWWRRLATRAGVSGLPADMTVAGSVQLNGEGTWRDGTALGQVNATIAQGSASSATQNWNVPEFAVTAQLALVADGPLVQSFTLRAPAANAVGIAVHNIGVEAVGDEQHRLRIVSAGFDALGGRISLKPFTVDPLNPEIDTSAEMAGVSLAQLAVLVPQALREASGQVSGRIDVKWSAKLGPKAGAGSLTVTPSSPANLSLAATPGFLTQHAPERIQWLPDAFGKVAQWLALENPAYDTLRRIELGELPLQVETLSIELYPDGLDGARSAAVKVIARPADGSVVEKVTFDVNVSGPLDQVLKLGTSDRVKLNFGVSR